MMSNHKRLCMSRFVSWLSMASVLGACTTGLTAGTPEPDETVGETFRKVMARIDAQCREEKKGPYLDPKDPQYKEKRRYTDCDILRLKPEDPLSTPEGRFAHSIKLPSPHDMPKDVWRAGMTGEEYFKALCEAEAGEWVFRTVEGVEGVLALRPRKRADDYTYQHLYVMEDPYGHTDGEAYKPEYIYVKPERYDFFELPAADGQGVERFYGYDGREPKSMKQVRGDQRKAKYGYVWRGIQRPHDREHGIAGGELIVLDLDTQEVLGYRRGFARTFSSIARRGVSWEFTLVCPRYEYRGGRSKDFDFNYWFIGKVLRSKSYEIHFKKLRGEVPWNQRQPTKGE